MAKVFTCGLQKEFKQVLLYILALILLSIMNANTVGNLEKRYMLFTDDEHFHTTRAAAGEKSGQTQMERMQCIWTVLDCNLMVYSLLRLNLVLLK